MSVFGIELDGAAKMVERIGVGTGFSEDVAELDVQARVVVSAQRPIPRNRPSRRVAEKLALRDEGVAMRYLEIDGVWEDHVRYAVTVEEWRERRADLIDAWMIG